MSSTAHAFDPPDPGPAEPSPAAEPGLIAWYSEGFSDAFGDRLLLFDNAGPALELVRFGPDLTAAPGFEAALRDRVERLKGFGHPGFARLRGVSVLEGPTPQLALVSELVQGERLSKLLVAAEIAGLRVDPDAAIWMLRQLLPALEALHGTDQRLAHGTLGPERVVVTPDGDLRMTEFALGAAVETLALDRDQLWSRFRIAATDVDGGGARLDARSDVAQVAWLAMAVLLGRRLRERDREDADALIERACSGDPRAAVPLKSWLTRALTPGGGGFASAGEACLALDALLPDMAGRWSSHLLPDGAGGDTAGSREGGFERASIFEIQKPARMPRLTLPAAPLPPPPPRPIDWTSRPLRILTAVLAVIVVAQAAWLVWLLRGSGSGGSAQPAPSVAVRAAPAPATAPAGGGAAPAAPQAGQPEARAAAPASVTPAPAGAGRATRGSGETTAAPGSVIGWVAVESSFDVRVYANGRLLGETTKDRFRLPAGQHEITLANSDVGFRSTETVTIVPGQTVQIARPTSPP